MTRKHYIGLLMAEGIQRNEAARRANKASPKKSYTTLYRSHKLDDHLLYAAGFMAELAASLGKLNASIVCAAKAMADFGAMAKKEANK